MTPTTSATSSESRSKQRSSVLAHIRARALAATRRLDLHGKADTAWRHAFEPVELSDNPETWLQLTPQGAAFAGVRADSKELSGSLEVSGSAETFVGQRPPAVTATALPSLGREVAEPGEFDVVLPIRIGYDTLKDKIMQVVAAVAPEAGMSVRDAEVYPSSGKLVVGLRIAKSADNDPNAGSWAYLQTSRHSRLFYLKLRGFPHAGGRGECAPIPVRFFGTTTEAFDAAGNFRHGLRIQTCPL